MAGADDAEDLMIETIRDLDETVDVLPVGPTRLVLDPMALAAGTTLDAANALGGLLSSEFARTAAPNAAIAFAANYGVGPVLGRYASGTQAFYRYAKPQAGTTLTITPGYLVKRADGKTYVVQSHSITMSGDTPNLYYSAARNRYEIAVPITAIAVGSEFNAKAKTVNVLTGALADFDGTENITDIADGDGAENSSETVARGQVAAFGTSDGSHGGILKAVQNSGLGVDAAAMAFFTEHEIFQRRTLRPALDVHIIGSAIGEATELFTATLGQFRFMLAKTPAIGIKSVKKNNGTISGVLTLDAVRATAGSYNATDAVEIPDPCLAGDVIEIVYLYDKAVRDVQEKLFLAAETEFGFRTRLFNTDILARRALPAPIEIHVTARLQSGVNQDRVFSSIETEIRAYCSPAEFVGRLVPSEFRDTVLANVPSINKLIVTRMRRKTIGALDVGPCEFNKIERPVFLTPADLVIR